MQITITAGPFRQILKAQVILLYQRMWKAIQALCSR
nr:MAG TPA: hypothetical protein [Caudoviricetes sp.]